MKPLMPPCVDPAVQAPVGHPQRRRHDSDAVTGAVPQLPVLDGLILPGRRVAPSESTPTPILARRGFLEFNQCVIHQLLLGGETVDYLARLGETGCGEVLPLHQTAAGAIMSGRW
jgi:hypothetical protein